jgi:hypothetical protein
MERAANEAGIPMELLLATAIAESGLNSHAARYGVWPDVSFGLMQRIVLFHYWGNGSNTWENIQAVKDYVLANPEEDLLQGAIKLRSCLDRAGGDVLQALIAYNSGSVQPEGNWYWERYAGNIAGYRAALEKAKEMLNA